jgi:methyltransferase, mtaA/cmuA family
MSGMREENVFNESAFNERQRLLRALKKEQVDRPPVVCPGGMMNMITTDLMEISGVRWPQAHTDAQMMAELAYANYQNGCFENVGLPFDMVAEAEQMGAQITLGSECIEPHVTGYAMSELADFRKLNPLDMTRGRIAVALQAIRILKERDPNIPIIGNITGPISTASSLMEPVKFYKALKKNPEEADAFLTFVTTQLIRFARAQIEAGADVISVADPSGTGEILGPKLFERYTGKYLNLFYDAIRDTQVGTICHICGQMKSVYKEMDKVKSDALSFDSIVPMRQARMNLKDRVLMGNVSTYALEFGDPARVAILTREIGKSSTDIIAPACGLGTKSPIVNIQAILKTVREDAKLHA